jgi:hypothetical protein
MPPTSIMCAEFAAQAASRPSTKTGRSTKTSEACRPPPLCGSLTKNTSPGAIVSPWSASVARTQFVAA